MTDSEEKAGEWLVENHRHYSQYHQGLVSFETLERSWKDRSDAYQKKNVDIALVKNELINLGYLQVVKKGQEEFTKLTRKGWELKTTHSERQEELKEIMRKVKLEKTTIESNENVIKTSNEALKISTEANKLSKESADTAKWSFWLAAIAVLASLFAAYTAYTKK